MTLATADAQFFVLRTPLLPVDTLAGWSGGLGARAAYERGEPLEPALAADRGLLRTRLADLIARPEVREAIFIASPSLEDAIEHWRRHPESDRGERAERALVRYLCRMAARATPFGLFAGISIGDIADKTCLAIGGRESCRRHTRLDNDYLFALVQALARDAAVRDAVCYRPNDSLWRAAGSVRYVEARLDGTRRTYHLVSVADSEELRALLSRSAAGATRGALVAALVSDDIEAADAKAFVDELIASQLLIPSLELQVTGSEPLPTLVRELRAQPSLEPTAELLAGAAASLVALDQAGLGAAPRRYRDLAEALAPLPAPVELPTLFQVDLVRPAAHLTIGDAVVREIDRAVDILHRVGGRLRDPLARFRDAFHERYEDREVPILEALDEDLGLGGLVVSSGDPSPLLRGVNFPVPVDDEGLWGDREKHLLSLLGRALQNNDEEIALDAKDLERLALPNRAPLPHAFEVFGSLLAPSATAVDRGEFRLWFRSASGPPGAKFLGRFCHADSALAQRVSELIRAEERHDTDAIYAEVVHLPEGRLGNILLRPQLHRHEITYLGRSGAAAECQIPASDLLVSLREGRFVLRSARLGGRVVPRLTTAHNFSRGLGVYRFLCLLQFDGVASSLAWDWGPLASAPFLPRVRVGRTLLSPRRWNVAQEESTRLAAGNADKRFRSVQDWRRQRQLPRWIALADGDNRLPVDLDNALAVDAFVHDIKNREAAAVEELYFGADDVLVDGPDGRYVHELIVPMVRRVESRPMRREPTPNVTDATVTLARRFAPGSAWLYAKLYTSPAIADEVLTGVIGPVTRELLDAGDVTRWFFIRYRDPDHHLRWRLSGDPSTLDKRVRRVVEAAAQTLLDDGRVWRVQFDTYQREEERYGGPEGIVLAEEWFHADSDAVLAILELLDEGDPGLDERWRLALRGIDQLLADLGFDLAAKRDYTRRWTARAMKDPTTGPKLRAQFGERYASERERIESLLDRTRDPKTDIAPGLALYGDRSRRLTAVATELRRLERDGRLRVTVADLAQSYIHMHVNRLLRSAHREHEVMLHDFLHRLYEAQTARAAARHQSKDSAP